MYESLEALDHIRLNFSPAALHSLNIAIAVVMFGVALEIKLDHFKALVRNPRSPLIGVFSQFIVLPALTFLLVIALKDYLSPTMALGMILVASAPGGNISNFISSLSKANLALSVSLTAFATLSAIIFTPLNFAFWGKMAINVYSHDASTLVRPLEINAYQMFQTVFIILGIPLMLGVFVNSKFPVLTAKILKPIKRISIVIFMLVIILAFKNNIQHFLPVIKFIFFIVLIHNAMALSAGYFLGKIFKRPLQDRRTLAIETGIQNSGLALILIFNPKIFPPEMELGGMAIIAAWWGIWHMVSGFGLAAYWSGGFTQLGAFISKKTLAIIKSI
ncbi:MAG: bile acid:sodium symporter family protein [Bacteroidales bacterium]|jgi:BASS family bile acid:Na+ symporter|nr:bile acid:sodium symporter family protein [Bacteroidales bacterium]